MQVNYAATDTAHRAWQVLDGAHLLSPREPVEDKLLKKVSERMVGVHARRALCAIVMQNSR